MPNLNKRHQAVLNALHTMGGEGTTKEIAKRAGIDTNGVSQSLSAMNEVVVPILGKGSNTLWRIRE